MKTIRWGMIGCGDVTELKSGPALQKANNSQLVAVMCRTREKARDYAARHGVPKWFDEGESLIRDPEVDIVYVATPPSSHMEYTLMAAKAGKPVYVEKPMARTFQECQTMIDACKRAGVPIFVAYYRRSLPRFLKVKEILDSGGIGQIRSVAVTLHRPLPPEGYDSQNLPWRVNPEIAGAGQFLDLASHTLDYLDYILGPIVKATGNATNHAGLYPAEDIVAGSFIFQSGVHGTGLWCFTAFAPEDVTEIVGSKGKISFSTFDTTPVVLTASESVQQFSIDNPIHIQQPLIQAIVDELNGVGRCPSTGQTAARTSRVMDCMLESWRDSHKEECG
ncbi:MAG TPA: Gfo/Idh/MocA family oxidoreductase [Acidobacteriota bacterium]|jgi:predicted dehydrogenase|nr:Gfo/Idh/MocA family oxidoreductase [Acidobacteriota bacterium]